MSCISEISGYLLGLYGKEYSRKKWLTFYLVLCSLASLPVALISQEDVKYWTLKKIFVVIFASLGKVFASSSIYLMYHYSSLIYPTSVRNTLVSYVSSFGRLGAIIAPQINLLRFVVWGPLPYYIFCANTFLASLASLILPNDKNIKHEI